jgi:hypothetical protein
VCEGIPSSVENSAVFLLNLKDKTIFANMLCDSMGVWSANGVPKDYLVKDGEKIFLRPKGSEYFDFIIFRKYFVHSMNENVKKYVNYMTNRDNKLCNIGIIQYIFRNGPVNIRDLLRPHGHSNEDGNLFSRTYQSTKDKMRSVDVPTNQFRSLIINENGGLEQIDNISVLPRNYDQIFYERNKDKAKIDELTNLLFKKINTTNSSIHYLSCIPELAVILLNNQHKLDIQRFCEASGGSVLGVDTTFNVGDFLTTITTYRHLLLLDRKTRESPVLIGPVLLHQNKTKRSYLSLSSQISFETPSVSVFGTDGDKQLYEAFQLSFPKAQHLLCDIHMKDNVEMKLNDLKISDQNKFRIVNLIFGSRIGKKIINTAVHAS